MPHRQRHLLHRPGGLFLGRGEAVPRCRGHHRGEEADGGEDPEAEKGEIVIYNLKADLGSFVGDPRWNYHTERSAPGVP